MRIIVCGGRKYYMRREMFDVLDKLHETNPITEVIHGDQKGADKMAGEWAKLRKVPCTAVAAEWEYTGPAAGPIRNRKMADMKPDACIPFSGGHGTASMVRIAKAAGIKVLDHRHICKTGRVRYVSEESAAAVLKRAQADRAARGCPRAENGYYECPLCGGWHLTSHFKNKNTASVDTRAEGR